MAKTKAPSSPKKPHRHRYQLRRRPKRHDPVIVSDNTGVLHSPPEHDNSRKMMVDSNADTIVKTGGETPQQKLKSGPALFKMPRQRHSRRAKLKTGETPQQNLKSGPALFKMPRQRHSHRAKLKTGETPQQNLKSGPALSEMPRQRHSRRAKLNTSSPRMNEKTKNVNVQKTNVNNDETSRIKIRLKGWKVDPANVKVIISNGKYEEQPCIEPKSKVKIDPQGALQQRKVGSIVLPNNICKPTL